MNDRCEVIEISMTFLFVRDWVVKDASCYLRNNQLNGEVLWYLYP